MNSTPTTLGQSLQIGCVNLTMKVYSGGFLIMPVITMPEQKTKTNNSFQKLCSHPVVSGFSSWKQGEKEIRLKCRCNKMCGESRKLAKAPRKKLLDTIRLQLAALAQFSVFKDISSSPSSFFGETGFSIPCISIILNLVNS